MVHVVFIKSVFKNYTKPSQLNDFLSSIHCVIDAFLYSAYVDAFHI